MKNNRLEDLFREKLQEMTIEPSDEARKLFINTLQRKSHRLWYKRMAVAAGFLLVMAVGIALLVPGQHTVPESRTSSVVSGELLPSALPDYTGESLPVTGNISGNQPEQDTYNTPPAPQKKAKPAAYEGVDQAILVAETVPASVLIDQMPEISGGQGIHSKPEIAFPAAGMPADETEEPLVPDMAPDQKKRLTDRSENGEKPMKITIEYIAGNNKGGSRISNVKELYSKVNNLPDADEMLGDIRSLKDQLFAIDLKNINKSEIQTNKEK